MRSNCFTLHSDALTHIAITQTDDMGPTPLSHVYSYIEKIAVLRIPFLLNSKYTLEVFLGNVLALIRKNKIKAKFHTLNLSVNLTL